MAVTKQEIGIYGITPGSLALARRLGVAGHSISMCARPGVEVSGSALGLETDSPIRFYPGFAEARAALGPMARVFSFQGYEGFIGAVHDFVPFLREGDIIFESNAFPFSDIVATESEYAKKGAAWVPIKLASGADGTAAGFSVLASGRAMDEGSRALLSSLAAPRLDGRICYAELDGPDDIAAARASYRAIIDATLQGYADAYRILSGLLRMSPFEARMVFADWGKTELCSPILDGMRDILGTMDDSGEAALARIMDTVKLDSGDLGAIALSLSLKMPPPLSSAAFSARVVSGLRDERLGASVALAGAKSVMPRGSEFLPDLRDALIASFSLAMAQSLTCLRGEEKGAACREAGTAASAWAGASLLQGPLMDQAAEILGVQTAPKALLMEPGFQNILNRCQAGLRKTVSAVTEAGIPAPVITSALSLYDSFRSEQLSSNLVAAGLDYFFGVGFERVDRPRTERYHLDWKGDGSVTRVR